MVAQALRNVQQGGVDGHSRAKRMPKGSHHQLRINHVVNHVVSFGDLSKHGDQPPQPRP